MRAARLGEHSAVEFTLVNRSPILAMRSRLGVGITPPKVLAAPKPVSSVMISKTFGAPGGGATRGGQKDLDWSALRLISPPNGTGGGGSTSPWIWRVAEGAPGGASVGWTPATAPDASALLGPPGGRSPMSACWARAVPASSGTTRQASSSPRGRGRFGRAPKLITSPPYF